MTNQKSVLGVGGQGTVVLCYSEKSKIDCAVKVIKMGNNEVGYKINKML